MATRNERWSRCGGLGKSAATGLARWEAAGDYRDCGGECGRSVGLWASHRGARPGGYGYPDHTRGGGIVFVARRGYSHGALSEGRRANPSCKEDHKERSLLRRGQRYFLGGLAKQYAP